MTAFSEEFRNVKRYTNSMQPKYFLIALGAIGALLVVAFAVDRGGGEPLGAPLQANVQNTAEVSLTIEDLKPGDGAEVKTGNTVSVHYVGTLEDASKFDSSRDRGTPFEFTVGEGRVIPGWEQGLLGMKVGGKRKLVIPPELAYGENSPSPLIPPNSTLIFEIELLAIK